MSKKVVNKELSRDFVLVPVGWLDRLIDLSNEEGVGAQQLKGYISSGQIILLTGKRIDEQKAYEL